VLVLDDLHAAAIPGLYPALEFWLAQEPPHVHTVLITRQDPPLPLARWRVRGQLTEIRQHDLRLDGEETAALIERSTERSLSSAEIAALEERTEGWVAGVQMAALALQHAGDGEVSRFISGFSGRHHFVLDYLTDEVLRRQPDRVRTFLLYTCVLEEMNGSLCDALLGTGDAQSILEHLEHSNLFVVPLDEERTGYRYHRLFAELQRARLQATRPGEIPGLHRKAAAWYEREGRGTQAVHHALQTGDAGWAADLIERVLQLQTTISRLNGTTLLAWLAALPPEQVRARPRLQVLAARACYVTGQHDRAERTLDDLEHRLRTEPADPGAGALLASIAADRASYAAMRGEVHRALQWARPALASAKETLAQLRPASVLGLACLRAGDVAEASRAFEQAIEAAQQARVPIAAVPFAYNLAEVRFLQGQLHQALVCCDRADGLARDASSARIVQASWSAGLAHAMRARVAYERGQLDDAAAHAQQAVDGLRQSHITLGQETLYGLLARIEQTRGRDEAADVALERARQIAAGNDVPRLIELTAATRARVRLAQGAVSAAARWADEYAQIPAPEYLREFADLTLARIALARGQTSSALAILDRLLAQAQGAGRWGPAIEALALRALALQAAGKENPAQSSLSQALVRAGHEGHVRPFAEGGAPMVRLLAQVADHLEPGAAASYARTLLAAIEPRQSQPPAPEPSTALSQPLLIEPLTARETDVLRLLAQGLTNAEIGRQLVISLPTVKSHTRNLYGKLGVHDRRAAVRRARNLGLLDDSPR
jgi:LuxR family maltose regulon positive regulatory protein